MAEKMTRRRVEIPADVYAAIEREARWLHVSVTAYVTIVLQDATRANARQRQILLNMPAGPAVGVAGLTREEERAAVEARDRG